MMTYYKMFLLFVIIHHQSTEIITASFVNYTQSLNHAKENKLGYYDGLINLKDVTDALGIQ